MSEAAGIDSVFWSEPLGITSARRTNLVPDLPTMMEAGVPDYEVITFNGIVAPAATPVLPENYIRA
jgi:tripartite-type tricarboxylate transporter receptor subunit TctC